MENITDLIQVCLDAGTLSLCCEAIFRDRKSMRARDALLFPSMLFLCILARGNFAVGEQTGSLFLSSGFEIAPTNNPFLFAILVLAVLLLSSVLLGIEDNRTAFCGTLMVFSIYLLTRFLSIVLFALYGADDAIMFLGSRVGTLLLIIVLIITPAFGYFRQLTHTGGFLVQLTAANITVFLMAALVMTQFQIAEILSRLWAILTALLLLLLLDSILLYIDQRRFQERKRIHMIEQYVPIVEELISQVRARQHEFNNRLLAIESAVASAETLEEAKGDVAKLSKGLMLNPNDQELLTCDSKIIAGMLFGKIKQAEVSGISVKVELHGLFKKSATSETEWIEIIGIFLDNAIEASSKGDTIYLKCRQADQHLELTVSNPHSAISNTEFMSLFRKGTTTKTESELHGFGLYNVLCIAERFHGKIITRNEQIAGTNFVVFGVILP